MAKIFVASFKAGKRVYEQYLNASTEDTFINDVDSKTTLFRTNEGGWTHNKHGSIMGRFRKMENGYYQYQTIDHSMQLKTKFNNILEAQRDVFSVLLTFGYKE